jgi:hypothetical protein
MSTMSNPDPLHPVTNGDVTQRKLLQGAGVGALVVGGGGLPGRLRGRLGRHHQCRGRGGKEGKPVSGGVLRVGAQRGSNADTLDAHSLHTIIDSWANNVHGISPSVLGQALGNFQFQKFWMT